MSTPTAPPDENPPGALLDGTIPPSVLPLGGADGVTVGRARITIGLDVTLSHLGQSGVDVSAVIGAAQVAVAARWNSNEGAEIAATDIETLVAALPGVARVRYVRLRAAPTVSPVDGSWQFDASTTTTADGYFQPTNVDVRDARLVP